MKFKIIVTLSILLFLGCSKKAINNSLNGGWYNCGNDGYYLEMYIDNNKYRYSSNNGTLTPWEKFKISGDTLIQFNTQIYPDSVLVYKAIFSFAGGDQLKLAYLTSDENWTMSKIEKSTLDFENEKEISKETTNRAKKIRCVDKRSGEQKRKDSLERKIDFQF